MPQDHGTTAGTEAHTESGSPLTQPQPGLMIWTLVTFVLLLLILKRLAWKPMLEMLDKREKSISEALEKSEQARADAEKILTEQKDILAKARRDAQELLERSRQDGEKSRDAALAQARGQAEKIIADGKQAIEHEKKTALQEIRKVAVDLALGAAARVVEVNVDDARQREQVNSFVDELQQSKDA